MALSHHDHEALSIRVERTLVGFGVFKATIRGAAQSIGSAPHSSGTSASNPDVVVMSMFSSRVLALRESSSGLTA